MLFWLTRPTADFSWPAHAPIAFLMPALVYPVLEEIVFRGAVQGALWKTRLAAVTLGPFSGPNLMTSAVFFGLHIFLRPTWLSIGIIVPSLVFGYFRDRYQGLTPPIILHIFYNTGFLLIFVSIE
jgi:membrane protease YdiL (CAAX protease family)